LFVDLHDVLAPEENARPDGMKVRDELCENLYTIVVQSKESLRYLFFRRRQRTALKNKPEHFENAPAGWLIKVKRSFLTLENEKGRLPDGFDETNKQTPESLYEILRKNCSILRLQKGRFFRVCSRICERGSSNLPSYQNNAKISFFLSAEFERKKGGNPLVF